MVNISLPSLRIDAFSLDIMSKVQDVKKSSLTFAPEAGSQRLRDVINKGLTEEVILKGAAMAFEGGWTRVKLYFMLGLPTETEEDIRGIAELSNKIAALFFETVPKEKRTGQVQIVASTSFFIPKPFTPFQWAKMNTKDEFLDKARLTKTAVREQLNQKRIKYNWHEADVSMLEGVFARGDRRIGEVVRKAYENMPDLPMKKAVFTIPGVNSLRMMYGWKPLPNAAWILIFTPPGKEGWTRSSPGISLTAAFPKNS